MQFNYLKFILNPKLFLIQSSISVEKVNLLHYVKILSILVKNNKNFDVRLVSFEYYMISSWLIPLLSSEIASKYYIYLSRSSRPEVFCKKAILRNFAKFAEKHLCHCIDIISQKLKTLLWLKINLFDYIYIMYYFHIYIYIYIHTYFYIYVV